MHFLMNFITLFVLFKIERHCEWNTKKIYIIFYSTHTFMARNEWLSWNKLLMILPATTTPYKSILLL